MKIGFINTGTYRDAQGHSYFADPVHLVAMHRICCDAGHESMIFQLGFPSYEASTAQIARFQPDVLALSFLDEEKFHFYETDVFLQSFRNKGITLLIGGPEIQLDHPFYTHWLSHEGRQTWRAALLVKGPGECLIQALAPHDFALEDPATAQAIRDVAGTLHQDEHGIYHIQVTKELPLEQQKYERDYDLAPYGGVMCAKWAIGCWAACGFCFNIPRPPHYKSPQLAALEAQHLLDLGAKLIEIASPQFTAHPEKASLILDAVSNTAARLSFATRVDTLFLGIRRYESIWRRFAQSHQHQIAVGVDSFLPERLLRLQKYSKLQQANEQPQKIEAILQFFQGTSARIHFYLIPIDWQMDLAEAEKEIQTAADYLYRYPDVLRIPSENIVNRLSHSMGSPFAKHMAPRDFLRFERDPRLLLLHHITWDLHHTLHQTAETFHEPTALMEEVISLALIQGFLDACRLLRELSVASLPLDRWIERLSNHRDTSSIIERLLTDLPPQEASKIHAHIERTKKQCPKSLAKTLDTWLECKARSRKLGAD